MAGALRRQEREPGPRSAAGFRLSRERLVLGWAVAGGLQAGVNTAIEPPAPPAGELPVTLPEAPIAWKLPKTGNPQRLGTMRGMLLSGLAHLAIIAALAVWQTAPSELSRGGEEEMAIEVVVLAAEPSLATEAGAKPAEPAMPEGEAIRQAVADAPPPAEPQQTIQEARADAVDPAAVALPEVPVAPVETKPAEPAAAKETAAVAPAPEPVEAKTVFPSPPPELPPVPLQATAPDPGAIPKTAEAEIIEAAAEIAPELPKQKPASPALPVAEPAPQPVPAASFRTAEARVPVPISVPKPKPLPRPVRAKIVPPEPAETPARPATPRPAKIAKHKSADGEGRGNAGAGREVATRQASAAGGTSGPSNAAGASEIASYRGTVLAHLARFKTYPDSARDADIHGRAVVSFTLSRSGGVTSVSLGGSSGAGILDAATLAMVRRAAPFPAMPAGGPAAMSFTAAIRYDLR